MKNEFRHIGKTAEALDGRDRVAGAIRYCSDLVRPGMLHGKILHSPHPHARITAIDLSRAALIPGVVAIVTAKDLADCDPYYGAFIRDQPVLALGKVRYVGEPVAAVAADTQAAAWRALEQIRVSYEPLQPLATVASALAADAEAIFDRGNHETTLVCPPMNGRWHLEPGPNEAFRFEYATGDIEECFKQAEHIFEDSFSLPPISHFALEPHVALAEFNDRSKLCVWSNNQDPFLLRDDIARIFGLRQSDVTCFVGAVGGGFGSKSYCKIEPLAVLLARKAQRPVRLALTQTESILTVREHGAEIRLRTGVSSAGKALVRDAYVLLDAGAYADASPSVAMRIGTRLNGPYQWAALRASVRVVRTTTTPAGSFRGFGAPQVAWASESQIDMIARRIARDPVHFRMDNFVRPGQPGAPGESALDTDHLAGLRSVVSKMAPSATPRPGRGIGYAVALKGGGSAHSCGALVSFDPNGRISVSVGVTDIGQGAATILRQVAAECLAVPLSSITINTAIDTDVTPFNAGTHASTGAAVGSLAISRAAQLALDELISRCALALQCPRHELRFADHSIFRGDRRHALADILNAEQSAVTGEALVTSGGGWTPIWTGVEVEVDDELGTIKVLRIVSAVDAGRAINPQRCISQIEGAAAQGLGQALFEQLMYDEGGVPLNATPLQYRVPRLADMPDMKTNLLEQGLGPGAFGIKGIGESGNLTIPAAIANAVADAVGIRVTELPLTPAKVFFAGRVARQVSGALSSPGDPGILPPAV